MQTLTVPTKDCPFSKCDGSGFVWYKDWSKRQDPNGRDEWMEECECNKDRVLRRKLKFAKIPETFRESTINGFNINAYEQLESKEIAALAKKAATNYVKHFEKMQEKGKGLYFYSYTKGSGKTKLISSIANALIKQYSVDLIFITGEDLLNEIKGTFGKDSRQSTSEMIKIFRVIKVLVIDDFGIEAGENGANDWVERTFTSILNDRLEAKLVTIFSSNIKIDDLDQYYKSGRLSSRVKEMAPEIPMPEESVRVRKADYENTKLEELLYE